MEERGGMAARSEAEANSLLVYKSPDWKGGVLYFQMVKRFTSTDTISEAIKSNTACSDSKCLSLVMIVPVNAAMVVMPEILCVVSGA